MKSQINVGLVGFGTVGTGTAKILLENRDLVARRVGVPLVLQRIVDLDLTTDRGIVLPDGLLSSDLSGLLNDPEIDIVIYFSDIVPKIRYCRFHPMSDISIFLFLVLRSSSYF